MMLGSEMQDNTIEVAPPQAEGKGVRFTPHHPHRERTMEEYTTEVGSTQSEAKVRFTPHPSMTMEDDRYDGGRTQGPSRYQEKESAAEPGGTTEHDAWLRCARQHHRSGSTPSNTNYSRNQSPF